jgi:PAS domain S-box-containing protein
MRGWVRQSRNGNRSKEVGPRDPTNWRLNRLAEFIGPFRWKYLIFAGFLLLASGFAGAIFHVPVRLWGSVSLFGVGFVLSAAGSWVTGHHLRVSAAIAKDQQEKLRALEAALNQERQHHEATREELRQLRIRWKTLLETIPDIVVEVNKNFVFTMANPAARRFYGEDMLGREAAEYLLYPQPVYSNSQVLLDGSDCTLYLEDWLRRKDGTGRLISWHGRTIKNEDGKVLGILGIGRDITDLRALQASYRTQTELVTAIGSAAQDAIILIDHCGRITYWNQAATKIFGYAAEEVLGKDAHRLLCPPELLPAYERNFPHFARTGQGGAVGKTLRLEAIRKDGSRIPIELSLGAFKSKGLWLAVAVIRDLTLTVQQEKERQLTERRYHALCEHTEDLVWLAGQDLQIQYINPAAGRFLGVPPEALVGKSLGEILPPSAFETLKDWVDSQYSGKKVSEGNGLLTRVRYLTAGQTQWDAQLKCTVIPDETGKPWLIMGVSRPILTPESSESPWIGNSVVIEFLSQLIASAADGVPVSKFLQVLEHFFKSARLIPEESRILLCRRCRRTRKSRPISHGLQEKLSTSSGPSPEADVQVPPQVTQENTGVRPESSSHSDSELKETPNRGNSPGQVDKAWGSLNSQRSSGANWQAACTLTGESHPCLIMEPHQPEKGTLLPVMAEAGRVLGILQIQGEGLSPAAESLLTRWVVPILALLLLRQEATENREELERGLERKIRQLRSLHALVRLGCHQDEDSGNHSLHNLLGECASILQNSLSPDGWTGVRILWEGEEVATEHFCDGPWKLASPLWAEGKLTGAVEVSSPIPLEFLQSSHLNEARLYLDHWATMLGLLLSTEGVPTKT